MRIDSSEYILGLRLNVYIVIVVTLAGLASFVLVQCRPDRPVVVRLATDTPAQGKTQNPAEPAAPVRKKKNGWNTEPSAKDPAQPAGRPPSPPTCRARRRAVAPGRSIGIGHGPGGGPGGTGKPAKRTAADSMLAILGWPQAGPGGPRPDALDRPVPGRRPARCLRPTQLANGHPDERVTQPRQVGHTLEAAASQGADPPG